MFNFTNIAKEIAFSDISQVITVAQKNNEAEILFSININKEEIYQKKKVFFAQKNLIIFMLFTTTLIMDTYQMLLMGLL